MEFLVTQNETPKMVKISASTNKFSQNLAEHVVGRYDCMPQSLAEL